jgi:hypothetical protein
MFRLVRRVPRLAEWKSSFPAFQVMPAFNMTFQTNTCVFRCDVSSTRPTAMHNTVSLRFSSVNKSLFPTSARVPPNVFPSALHFRKKKIRLDCNEDYECHANPNRRRKTSKRENERSSLLAGQDSPLFTTNAAARHRQRRTAQMQTGSRISNHGDSSSKVSSARLMCVILIPLLATSSKSWAFCINWQTAVA